MTIVGNHKPNFHTGKGGGLVHRMLLFEAGGFNYRNKPGKQISNLGKLIVASEGPQLLAYTIYQSILDYADAANGSPEWDAMMAPLRYAAMTYVAENSFIRQWAEERDMVEDEELNIDTMRAYSGYLAFAKEWDNRTAKRHTLVDFKQALQTEFRSIRFGKRTTRPNANRACIIGFGQKIDAFDDSSSNVVALKIKNPTQPELMTNSQSPSEGDV